MSDVAPSETYAYKNITFIIKYIFDAFVINESNIPGVANLRLASHMRLFEGLFVDLDKCTRVPFSFLFIIFFKISFRMCFKIYFKLLTTNMKDLSSTL